MKCIRFNAAEGDHVVVSMALIGLRGKFHPHGVRVAYLRVNTAHWLSIHPLLGRLGAGSRSWDATPSDELTSDEL